MIIFTDLDGTLLDHDTYSWQAAEPALAKLRQKQIPLILASSKTAAEIAPLRASLGFAHCPAIVENGAGILPAFENADHIDQSQYANIRAALAALPTPLREPFEGFGDMGPKGIVQTTGLADQDAALAAKRAFSEPGLWHGTADAQDQFEAALAHHKITARSGGRFLTLSFGKTKADQINAIRHELFGEQAVKTIALGDAPNDIEMLLEADIGFLIANPHGKPVVFPKSRDTSHITAVSKTSPHGWNQAVLSVL